LNGRAFVDLRLRDGGCDRCDGEPEGEPLDEPILSPIAAHLPAPFLLTSTADAHKTDELRSFFPNQAAASLLGHSIRVEKLLDRVLSVSVEAALTPLRCRACRMASTAN
jgi:hypothetical protein